MSNKFYFSFLLFLFSLAVPVLAASLDELIGPETAAILRTAGEPLTEVRQKNLNPRFLPRHEGLERSVADIQNSLEPNIFVEALSLYRKPFSAEKNKEEQTGLLNQLLALSTLAGIQYYSESRKTMRIFYESSYIIDDPVNKNPLPDPVYAALPDSLILYARQKDLTFGDNIYRYDYHTGADVVFFVQENITPMKAGIIQAVGKNKFRTLVAVFDAGDSLLIYAAAMAKTVSLPGMGDRIGASFANRMKAIFQWFAIRADMSFGKNEQVSYAPQANPATGFLVRSFQSGRRGTDNRAALSGVDEQ